MKYRWFQSIGANMKYKHCIFNAYFDLGYLDDYRDSDPVYLIRISITDDKTLVVHLMLKRMQERVQEYIEKNYQDIIFAELPDGSGIDYQIVTV